MDGFEATQLIREFLYQQEITQPIIIGVTGHTESEYIIKGLDSGMNMVLPKPINGNNLKSILNMLHYL